MKRFTKRFALCLNNAGNEASLILGKVYRVLPDACAAKDELVRIVDESDEDYLFARSQFELVELPEGVRRKLLALQKAGSQVAANGERRAGLRLVRIVVAARG